MELTMSIRFVMVCVPPSLHKEHISILLGILTLSLDKESYERAGLVGKPDGVEGARGTRARWGECLVAQI